MIGMAVQAVSANMQMCSYIISYILLNLIVIYLQLNKVNRNIVNEMLDTEH